MTFEHPGSPEVATTSGLAPSRLVEWDTVVAGALAAAALALVLHSFAIAIGLSVSSAAPTWRDASIALVLLSGLYLVIAATASYGLGGYVAGLIGPRAIAESSEDSEFRDGMRGLLVWALASLLTAALAIAAGPSLTRLAVPGPGAPPASSGEAIIAFDIDRLFRGARQTDADLNLHHRQEAARILLTTSSHRGMQPDDSIYLVRLVAGQTGLAQADAERRVDEVAARARDNIARARRTAVLIAFAAGAAALLGAAAAWFSACAGGRVRRGAVTPHGMWDWRKPVWRP
jgi:hypothetical protein